MTVITLKNIPDALAALRNAHLVQSLYDEGEVIMDGTLLTLHGAEHRSRRILEFKVFRRSFLRYYETEIFPRALAEVLELVTASGGCDLVKFGHRITMNLASDFAGVDRVDRSAEETAALLELVMTFSEGATLVHSTRNKDTVRAEVKVALEEFDRRFLKPSITRREALLEQLAAGAIAEEDLPRDVLTVLLRNEDRLELPPDLLRREIAFYLQAGSHSTANAMVHAMHNIFTWIADHPEDEAQIREDTLFLQRCVHESLRLYPASPVAWRRPVCPVTLANGARAGVGDRVEIDLWAANRSTDVYGDDADRFNPHRRVAAGNEPFGLTFGTGAHTCLGRDLDGGLVPRGKVDVDGQSFGIVTLLIRSLLDAGVSADPARPPSMATNTARQNWGCYPVVFYRN
jgi:cytochrome P450